MVRVRYKVIESFDPSKDYGRNLTRQVSLCLKSLKLDREFEPKEITHERESDVGSESSGISSGDEEGSGFFENIKNHCNNISKTINENNKITTKN